MSEHTKYTLKLGGIVRPDQTFMSSHVEMYEEIQMLWEQVSIARLGLIELIHCGEYFTELSANVTLREMDVVRDALDLKTGKGF